MLVSQRLVLLTAHAYGATSCSGAPHCEHQTICVSRLSVCEGRYLHTACRPTCCADRRNCWGPKMKQPVWWVSCIYTQDDSADPPAPTHMVHIRWNLPATRVRQETILKTMACENPVNVTPQSFEVSQVMAAFPRKSRVIKDIGSFTYIVTVQLNVGDVSLKLQLTESYPSIVPEIIVCSDRLYKEDNEKLTTKLMTEASANLGQPVIQKLISLAEGWLNDRTTDAGKSNDTVTTTGDRKKVPKGKPSGKSGRGSEKTADDKRVPLKTAEDVVNRVLWDDKLKKEDFFVGYVDRFKGTVEKNFSTFSWEDIATVDYNALAIPKHRIQYFKYRSEKIWDKASRLDRVFGSNSGGVTIYDIVSKHQQQPDLTCTKGGGDALKPRESSFTDFGKEASDNRTLRGLSHNAPRESCPQLSGQTDQDSNDLHCNDQQVWKDTSRPTHFLALRVTHEEIVRVVGQVQAHILKIQPLYGPCCIPGAALHITLCTLGLDTPEQVAHAAEVLHRIQPQLATSLPHTPLRVDGVDTFFNRVVYARVEQQPEFMEFVDHLKLLLWESGVEMRDVHHGYTPHVTIMKATKPLINQKGTKDVEPSLYKDYTDMYFGQQTLDRVYLCAMGGSKREDGFYECIGEIEFAQA